MKTLRMFLIAMTGLYLYLMIPLHESQGSSSVRHGPDPLRAPHGGSSDQEEATEAVISFEPEHLMSNTGNRRIGLKVSNNGAVPDMLLDELQKRTALVTYPEGTPVAASVTIQNNTAYKFVGDRIGPRDDYAFIDVTPSEPLGDRWYELVVYNLPATIDVLGDGLIGKKMPDGSVRSRFSPTSHPIVREFVQAQTGPGKTRAVAHFSEPIDDAARAGFVFTNLSGKGTCKQTPTLHASPWHAIADCENTDVTHTIDFSVGGARSKKGVGLREHARGVETRAQQHYAINFATASGDANHRYWRPD